MSKNKEFYISPDLDNDNLTETIECLNESAEKITLPVVKEIPLTIYLNKQDYMSAVGSLSKASEPQAYVPAKKPWYLQLGV